MEKPVHYIFMPSLKQLALIKAAVTLYNRVIQDLISKHEISSDLFNLKSSDMHKKKKSWLVTEAKMKEEVLKLPLPNTLQKDILKLIKPIGNQVMFCTCLYFEGDIFWACELCWTPQGTVDLKKTAKTIISNERLDICTRYTLACLFCFENYITELWNIMTEDERDKFYCKEHPCNVKQPYLVIHWTYVLKGEMFKLEEIQDEKTPYQRAYEAAFNVCNKVAIEYFWGKLTPSDKEDALVTSIGAVVKAHYKEIFTNFYFKHNYADIFCFLLSQTNGVQQDEVFRSFPVEILNFLLEWPCQVFFMETAQQMWNFLTGRCYNVLLYAITQKVKSGYTDYNYQELFTNFWLQSPIGYKRYVLNNCDDWCNVLAELCEAGDRVNIALLLDFATPVQKEAFIFCNKGKDTSYFLMYKGDWNLMRLLANTCISSKAGMIQLRLKLLRHLYIPSAFLRFQTPGNVKKFMDNCIQNYGQKRSKEVEESNDIPIRKRVCLSQVER